MKITISHQLILVRLAAAATGVDASDRAALRQRVAIGRAVHAAVDFAADGSLAAALLA